MKNSGEDCPLPETASLTQAFLKEKVKKKNKQTKIIKNSVQEFINRS